MRIREFYLAFCIISILLITTCSESVFAQDVRKIARYESMTLPGSWENEEIPAIISRLFITWSYDGLVVKAIEDCHDQNCAWAPGRLQRVGNSYMMQVNTREARRLLSITPIHSNRLHVRVSTRFRDSRNTSVWEYYFSRSGGSSRGASNK